jgi:hypothetical protein
MFETRVLRGEATGGWSKLCNVNFYNLKSSQNIVTITKFRRMREHVTRKGKVRKSRKMLLVKREGKSPL